ncbi:hypothetical protein AGMMS49546_07860 [Spirochaetia bacterium]|nr:hypothetical protein AGMMS49546_07860 [Spirochaetia bacterium]
MFPMGQVYTGKKTSILTNLIASVCIIAYIAGISYGAFKIYNSVHERIAKGEQEYAGLADLASSAGVLGFMDEPFIQTINDAIAGSSTILGVIITGPNGEYAFERDQGTIITWVNNSPRFKHPFGVSDPPHFMPLRIEGQRNVSIQVATGYIDYEFCIDILKRVLFMVLAGLTLAFFTLLLETLLIKNRVGSDQDSISGDQAEGGKEEGMSDDDFADIENTENRSGDDEGLPGDEPEAEQATADTEASADDDDFSDLDLLDESLADPEFPELPGQQAPSKQGQPKQTQASAPAGQPEPQKTTEALPPDSEPRGLFSPHGNIGWEDYTNERLDAELHRCASFEQDLVFIAMEFKDTGGLDSEVYTQFASDAVNFFTQRDLIFEKGDRGISIIVPNINLDEGFIKSEEFHNRILSKHAGVFSSRNDVCIGLSSRAGRLIDAERLMFEAFQALKKALRDQVSHIVAFKSDPEKYREFIRNRNRGKS